MSSARQTSLLQDWTRLPLPVAQRALAIDRTAADFLERTVHLASGTLDLAYAYALARMRKEGRPIDSDVWRALEQPTPGKVGQALRKLERQLPGCTGWGLDRVDTRFASLLSLVGDGQADPTVARALDAIAPLRNRWAHNEPLPAPRQTCADALFSATLALAWTNRLFAEHRLVWIQTVNRAGPGHWLAKAYELHGSQPLLLEQGAEKPVGGDVLPQHVVLISKEGGALELDLHPLVWFDGKDVWVLAATEKGRPVLRRTSDGEALPQDRAPHELATLAPLSVPERAVPNPPGPERSGPTPPSPERAVPPAPSVPTLLEARPSSRPTHLLSPAAALLAVSTAVCGVGGIGVALFTLAGGSASEEAPSTVSATAAGSAADRIAACRRWDGSTAPSDVGRWLTGVDVRWGEPVDGFDGRCGVVVRNGSTPTCAISVGRDLTPIAASGVPDTFWASAAFDTRHGLFEVTIRSRASADEIAAAISRRFGAPQRPSAAWIWLNGDVRISLNARSVVVARFLPLSDRYYTDREVLCPSAR